MTSSPPVVTVVVRTFNRPAKLRRALQSLSEQTYSPLEILVIRDGGAAVDVPEMLNLRLIESDENQGRAWAAQEGLSHASGDYILFHDDDDRLDPTAIEEMMAVAQNAPKAIGVICGYRVFNESTDGVEQLVKESIPALPPRLIDMAAANSLLTISTLFKREAALKAGGYNLDLEALEDWDLCLRVLMEGDFAVCPKVLASQYIDETPPENSSSPHSSALQHQMALINLQNHYLRDDLKRGSFGLGYLINTENTELKEDLTFIVRALKALKKTIFFWT